MIAVVTIVILGAGALIAYFQWRTTHQRVVLDLFERRLAIFDDLEKAIKGTVNAASRKEIEGPFWDFVRAEQKARFLFGGDVTKVLTERRADMSAVMAFIDIKDDYPDYHRLVDQQHEALQNLASFVLADGIRVFAPYMRMDQKMPSLWWIWRRLGR